MTTRRNPTPDLFAEHLPDPVDAAIGGRRAPGRPPGRRAAGAAPEAKRKAGFYLSDELLGASTPASTSSSSPAPPWTTSRPCSRRPWPLPWKTWTGARTAESCDRSWPGPHEPGLCQRADGDRTIEELPERVHSPHVNYVTPSGLRQLRGRVGDLLARRERLAGAVSAENKKQLLSIDRDLRYYEERIRRAILIDPTDQPKDEVRFGRWSMWKPLKGGA